MTASQVLSSRDNCELMAKPSFLETIHSAKTARFRSGQFSWQKRLTPKFLQSHVPFSGVKSAPTSSQREQSAFALFFADGSFQSP